MNSPETTITRNAIRRRGLRAFAIGTIIFAAILFLMYWLSAHNYRFQFALIAAGFPFAYACIGLIEVITGAAFQRLADSWMNLRGWQRGVLGTLIIVGSLVIILLVVTFFVMMFT